MTKDQTEKLKKEARCNKQETLNWMNSIQHKFSQIIYEYANGIEKANEDHEIEMFIYYLLRLKEKTLKETLIEE